MPTTCTNRDAFRYVNNLQDFKNHNNTLYAEWTTPTTYTVFSYGIHWPLHICYVDPHGERFWFSNADKASSTTSRHFNATRPNHTQLADCEQMKRMWRLKAHFVDPQPSTGATLMTLEQLHSKLQLLGFTPFDAKPGFYTRTFPDGTEIQVATSARDTTVFTKRPGADQHMILRFRKRWDDAVDYLQQEVSSHAV